MYVYIIYVHKKFDGAYTRTNFIPVLTRSLDYVPGHKYEYDICLSHISLTYPICTPHFSVH